MRSRNRNRHPSARRDPWLSFQIRLTFAATMQQNGSKPIGVGARRFARVLMLVLAALVFATGSSCKPHADEASDCKGPPPIGLVGSSFSRYSGEDALPPDVVERIEANPELRRPFRASADNNWKHWARREANFDSVQSFSRLPSPPDAAVAAELSDALADELKTLPLTQRRYMELRFYDGMSWSEIRAARGIPKAEAARLYAAETLVRRRLARRGFRGFVHVPLVRLAPIVNIAVASALLWDSLRGEPEYVFDAEEFAETQRRFNARAQTSNETDLRQEASRLRMRAETLVQTLDEDSPILDEVKLAIAECEDVCNMLTTREAALAMHTTAFWYTSP